MNKILLYKTPNDIIKLDALIQDEKVVSSISEHTTQHGALENKKQKSMEVSNE